MISRFLDLWCAHFHPAPLWPVSGSYRCPACLRVYPVCWEAPVARVRGVAHVEEAA